MAEPPDRVFDHRQWLLEALPRHERLAATVKSLLENMLKKEKIEFLSVTDRVKNLNDAIEKIERKGYRNPQRQITDLSGIRVVTYLEEQVDQISQVVKTLFDVDKHNSLDRSEILGDDKVGYRSTHFVCTLGPKRNELPENESLGDLPFEIQIRTVLQHAWAELAHDRSFKFGAALPRKIQRKLNLYSGMLEVVDSAFDQIAKDIEAYRTSIQNKRINQIEHLELDSISLHRFLNELTTESPLKFTDNKTNYPKMLTDLYEFGTHTLGDLKRIATPTFVKEYAALTAGRNINNYNVTRAAMLFADLHKAVKAISRPISISPSTFDWLASKYDRNVLDGLVAEGTIKLAESEKLGAHKSEDRVAKSIRQSSTPEAAPVPKR